MARNVSDLALMLDAMTGLTRHDPLSRAVPAGGYQAAMAAGSPPRRIGYTEDLRLRRIDPAVAGICRTASRKLTGLGAGVEDATPDFSGGIDCFQVLRALLFADVRGDLLQAHREQINPDIVWNIEKGLALTASDIVPALRTRHRIFHNVAEFFERYDLLVCPTVAVPPFPVEQRFPTEIAGEKLETYIDWMFLTFVLTLTGCPVVSLPCGVTQDGLPIGVQLVGRPHGDAELLGFARLAEQAFEFSPIVFEA